MTYEDFIAFHKKHYHPTNATFFTFGNIPAETHHERFEELALQYFDSKGEKVTTSNETRLFAPISQKIAFPSSDTQNPNQTHIIASWLLGPAHNAQTALESRILYEYLLEHSGSPLYHALESLPFTAAISPLSMFDDSSREIAVSTGIITDSDTHLETVKQTIFDTLKHIEKDGFDKTIIDGIIDKIDMQLRKQNISEPYGLSLFLQIIGAATHEENIENIADPSEILDTIRKQAYNPEYFVNILRENFIDNPHFTLLTAVPDANAAKREQMIEEKFCKNTLAKMTEEQKSEIKKSAALLAERQKTIGNVSILPKLDIAEIPRLSKRVSGRHKIHENHIHYDASTNGVRYIYQFFPIANIKRDTIFEAFITAQLLTLLGFGDWDYISAQNELSKSGDFWSSLHLIDHAQTNEILPFLEIGSRFLAKNTETSLKNLDSLIHTARFDEIDQIRMILDERILNIKAELVSNGHRTAMQRAGSKNTLKAALAEELGGITFWQNLKNFVKKSDTEIHILLANSFESMTKNIPISITIATEEFFENTNTTAQKYRDMSENFDKKTINEAWLTDLGVGYCAVAIPTIDPQHEDMPLLVLLGKFLWDGYLHSAIRERGGAYGSGANYDARSHCFRFFSYRDPRIEGTFEDFRSSIDWFLNTDHEIERLDEAKMGIIASLDTPKMPAQDALSDAIRHLKGYSDEQRNYERQKVLDATIDDLKRITKAYLSDWSQANRVVITGKQNREIVEKM